MNSYPLELLAQLSPVMFAAGLDSHPSSEKHDEFSLLIARLREALQNQRKVAIWHSEKIKAFQVVLVEKDARFPPRKLLSPSDPQYPSAHSPLSPLTPTSPLHPDGLIAPIWIRKHTTLIPSVFVLFLRIFEYPPRASPSPLESSDSDDRKKEQEERKRDTELASEVALRKKSTNERGIKLTVVLISSRKLLDDPTLDSRLTFIRRQSGLDSRAALFVLSPVGSTELAEFVKSLQQALYDPALEYYTAHSKRVRRKRNRHSQFTSYTIPGQGMNMARPLRPEGWTVRYEFKMACFAEFRGEIEVALKHYQDAYSTLIIMFGSTAILSPRTKRWAEAKVLADCINIKIAKLYLYNNEHALALSHYNAHIRVFGDFSRGWGIGEDTFEYWSWIARQYRVLAELLEQGAQSTLVIPASKPIPAVPHLRAGTSASGLEAESMRTIGLNPNHILQHPGFYYYLAARCTEMRREKFTAAIASEQSSSSASPGFANERKVDHLIIILELYTKAYEFFRKYNLSEPQNSVQSRLSLWVACRIAHTYCDSGKFDMAMKFFERIAKTYRRERWNSLLRPLLLTWHSCAEKLGDNELRIKLLLETIGHDVSEEEDTRTPQLLLLSLLKDFTPITETVVVSLPDAQPIFDSNIVFWFSETNVGEKSPFQLWLTAPNEVPIDLLPFSSLSIYLSHMSEPVIVRHCDTGENLPVLRKVNLGHVSPLDRPQEASTSLRWPRGGSIVFSGTTLSDLPTSLTVTKLQFTIEQSPWRIELEDSLGCRRGSLLVPKWLQYNDVPKLIPMEREASSFVLIKHRPHILSISFSHGPPAYLQEDYPIMINITNGDDKVFDIVVGVLLPPSETDGMNDLLRLGNEESSTYIKEINFGTLVPNSSASKLLHLTNMGVAGDRVLEFSIQSYRTNGNALQSEDVTETLKTLIVPAVEPFEVAQTVEYIPNFEQWPKLESFVDLDQDDFPRAGYALVKTTLKFSGPSTLVLVGAKLEENKNSSSKIIECFADDDAENYLSEYSPGDEHLCLCRVLIPTSGNSSNCFIEKIGRYLFDWKRLDQGEQASVSTTTIDLPPLQAIAEGLVAILTVPLTAKLHVPLSLVLNVRNYRGSKSAIVNVQMEVEPSDGFIVAGLKNGRLPLLLPGTEEKMIWRLIPMQCGHMRLPGIKVMDVHAPPSSRGADIESESDVEVVKVIYATQIDSSADGPTILVLP